MTGSYHKLLRRYSGYVRRAGHVEAASTALRTRSESMRDVIAYVATHNRFTATELQRLLKSGSMPEIRYRYKWLATLGRVSALQAFQTSDALKQKADTEFGLACLQNANRYIPQDNEHKQFHRLEAELLAAQGRISEAAELVECNEHLVNYYYGYLLADLDNPKISGTTETYSRWLEGFNRPFVENGLSPVYFSSETPTFNDLHVAVLKPENDGPKVSVIMTSYKPESETFLLAVESILNQSWRNLELIIVDDASPPEYKDTLQQAKRLDPRVTVIEIPENGGTYRARNVGLGVASGEFITGQDSDDWSHPARITMQVRYMLDDPAASGVVVEAIRVNEELIRTFPGRLPQRPCEVSLMTRASLANELGGYVDARKGADSEFRLRIEHFTGRKTHSLDKPLYLTRIGHESLSGADFKPGWSHPVRRAFWNASRHWHKNTEPSRLRLTESGTMPLPVPNRFKVQAPDDVPYFDVVFVGDWRAYSSTQRAMIDAIDTHRAEGDSVGIMHLESLLSPSKETTALSHEVQTLINDESVAEVVPDEKASAAVVIIHDPTVLQFSPLDGINLTSEITLISPDMAPCVGAKESFLYRPADCSHVAKKLFRGSVVWTSIDPAIRQRLTAYSDEISVLPTELPIVFRDSKWKNKRPKLIGGPPIVGRHSENFPELWPKDLHTTWQLWPFDSSIDVRILGDVRAFHRKYNQQSYPPEWLVFRDGDIRPESFMSGIDFFVYFPDEEINQRFSREALEAAASGALVILPVDFEELHGESAIYAAPSNVKGIINNFIYERSSYFRKTAEVQNYIEGNLVSDQYIEYIRSLSSNYDVDNSSGPEKHAFS